MNPARTRAAAPHWATLLARRLGTLWLLKMLGTMAGIAGFFVLYFWTLEATAARAITLPTVFLDHWVGVSDLAFVPYASLWVYVSLAPALAGNLASLRAHAVGALVIATLGMAAYWVIPTVTPASAVDWTQHPMLQMLKASDAGGNAFPSLHVAFAFYTARVLTSQLRSVGAPRWMQGLNWLWCVAIIHSTLATRQHVLVDVLGGLFLTWLSMRLVWGPAARALWRRLQRATPSLSMSKPEHRSTQPGPARP